MSHALDREALSAPLDPEVVSGDLISSCAWAPQGVPIAGVTTNFLVGMGLNTVRPAVYYIAMPRFLRCITSILPATIHRRNCEPNTTHKVSVGKGHLVVASHQNKLFNTTAFDEAHDHRLVI